MKTTIRKHTLPPWHTASDHTDYFRCIEKDDRLIARLQTSDSIRDEANAAFIVNAVNTHEELLGAAQAFLAAVRATHPTPFEDWAEEADRLGAAIVEAGA